MHLHLKTPVKIMGVFPHISVATSEQTSGLTTIFKLAWKDLPVTHTLAFEVAAPITETKSFKTLTPDL